jgi:hypothetical protein
MSGLSDRGQGEGSPPEEGKTSAATADDPARKKGELPSSSVGADIRDGVRRLTGADIGRHERIVARYLDRLSVPMLELDDVADKFDSWAEIADASIKVLGEARSRDLAAELGYAARRVLAVAQTLGYEPSDDE